jgi:hypothetical protein
LKLQAAELSSEKALAEMRAIQTNKDAAKVIESTIATELK